MTDHTRLWLHVYKIMYYHQTRNTVPMLFQCWASVEDGGPTLKQQWLSVPCLLGYIWVSEYYFTSLSAHSWQYRDRRRPEAGTMPYFFWINDFKGSFIIVHSTMDITAHSGSSNSLEHCICTTPMTNIRPGQGSNPVPLSFEPQPDRMCHRERPYMIMYYRQINWAVQK